MSIKYHNQVSSNIFAFFLKPESVLISGDLPAVTRTGTHSPNCIRKWVLGYSFLCLVPRQCPREIFTEE